MAYAMNEVVDSVLQAFQERLAAVETDLTDLRERSRRAPQRGHGFRSGRWNPAHGARGHRTTPRPHRATDEAPWIFNRNSVISNARRQGPHLHQSLRPPRLGAERGDGARAVGRHQAAPRERSRLDHRGDQGLRAAWTRRRRLPDRAQVVVHAEAVGRAAELPRRQCRRVRARHLQGPRDHAPRPAYAGRRLPRCRLRDGRPHRLHLCPRRVHPRARAAPGRRRPGL